MTCSGRKPAPGASPRRAQARAGSPLGREIAAYQARGDLVAVDADQPPDSVTAEIQARLSTLAHPSGGGSYPT